jgi:hypothetical protein
MRLYEFETPQTELLSFWDLAATLKLTKEAQAFHDAVLPWLNYNKASSLDKLITKPKYREVSKLQLSCTISRDGARKLVPGKSLNTSRSHQSRCGGAVVVNMTRASPVMVGSATHTRKSV